MDRSHLTVPARLRTLQPMFTIASFYRFVPVDDGDDLRSRLIDACTTNVVKGTILVAQEGINGTIAGPSAGVEAVISLLHDDDRFSVMPITWASADTDPFLRLKVRAKREIVALGVGDVDTSATATAVAPEEWNDLIADADTVVIDTRNHYEVAIGTFRGAIDPGTRSFTEFPAWVASSDIDRDAPIAMFCTGGIRCEKATAYLASQGFTNLFQLEGGILSYLERTEPAASRWDGECYVFDRRVSVGHGLEPGTNEVCPNCNRVVHDDERLHLEYKRGVTCGSCHDTITPDRAARFAERQKQIDLAAERGTVHLGRPA
jgi:UPF0176 protein